MSPRNKKQLGLLLMAVASLGAVSAQAAQTTSKKGPTPRDVEVDSVKDAYWNRTNDGDIEVVQNRQYAKKNRLSIQGSVGTVSSDPFLTVRSLGGSLGYHFSESFGIVGVYKKFLVSDSSYLSDLQSGLVTGTPSTANTNRPNSFYGGEVEWSPLYGKISLSGASIIHYDAHLLLGAGMTNTDSGKDFTPTIGAGPEFYLSNSLAIRLDYRFSMYKENVPETQLVTRPTVYSRTNYSHSVALGFEVFL